VEGVGSSSLRIEVGGAGASGAGEVTRADVFDSGQRGESSDPSERTVVTTRVQRTEVVGAGSRDPSGRPMAAPLPAAEVTRREVLDSGTVERPRRIAAGWLVGGGLVVAALSSAGVWVVKGGSGLIAPLEPAIASGAAVVEPESRVVSVELGLDLVEPKEDAKAVESEKPEVVPAEPEVVSKEPEVVPKEPEAVPTEPEAVPLPSTPARGGEPGGDRKKPAGLSDAEVKKKLARKIRTACGDKMAGMSVTVSFLVTSRGVTSLVTATPRSTAGECAKQQVPGTKFRPRKGETPMKIVVE
jgi:hypothetical protein